MRRAESTKSFGIILFLFVTLLSVNSCTKQKDDVPILDPKAEHSPLPQISQTASPKGKPFPPNSGYKPKNGYVPNEATAIKIAEAVIVPVLEWIA